MWLSVSANSLFIFIALYDRLRGMAQAMPDLSLFMIFLPSELSSFYCQEKELTF